MRNLKLFVIFTFVGLFSFMFMGVVNAEYAEGEFGNESCSSDMAFLNTAKTDYSFDKTSGQFTTSGKTVQEYREASTAQDIKVAFYEVSSDGKTLTAYVPSYTSTVSSEFTKGILEGLGISSSYKCDEVIKVTKTVSGGEATEPTECPDGYVYNTSSGQCEESKNGVVEKLESPNTASPLSIVATAIGCLLVVLAVYFYLKNSNVKKTKDK